MNSAKKGYVSFRYSFPKSHWAWVTIMIVNLSCMPCAEPRRLWNVSSLRQAQSIYKLAFRVGVEVMPIDIGQYS